MLRFDNGECKKIVDSSHWTIYRREKCIQHGNEQILRFAPFVDIFSETYHEGRGYRNIILRTLFSMTVHRLFHFQFFPHKTPLLFFFDEKKLILVATQASF